MVLWLGLATVAAWGCSHPSLPEIPPEGAEVRGRGEQRMQRETLRYLVEMADYVRCTRSQSDSASSGVVQPLQASLLMSRTDSAVAEMNAVTALYLARVGPLGDLYEAAGATCLPGSSQGAQAKVVDDQRIVFRTSSGGYYLNTLRQRCPSLQPGIVSSWAPGSFFLGGGAVRNLCRWDSIELVSGVSCRFGPFVPITEAQAAALLGRDSSDSTPSESAPSEAD